MLKRAKASGQIPRRCGGIGTIGLEGTSVVEAAPGHRIGDLRGRSGTKGGLEGSVRDLCSRRDQDASCQIDLRPMSTVQVPYRKADCGQSSDRNRFGNRSEFVLSFSFLSWHAPGGVNSCEVRGFVFQSLFRK